MQIARFLCATIMALAGTSAPASASGDSAWCESGGFVCPAIGVPWLSAQNDTRSNLLLYVDARNHLEALAYPPISSWPHSREDYLTWLSRAETDNKTDVSSAPERETLLIPLISALGLTLTVQDIKGGYDNNGRKISNNVDSVKDFLTALEQDAQLSVQARRALASGRLQLYVSVSEAETKALDVTYEDYPADSHAWAFRHYLDAATAFYHADYDAARTEFETLSQSGQPWVAEASAYMLFRVALNQSVAKVDWYVKDNADRAFLQEARARAADYQARWPAGRYSDSLHNLMRRVDLYSSDYQALATAYEKEILQATDASSLTNLIIEVENVMERPDESERSPFISAPDAPLLTFIEALRRLRQFDRWGDKLDNISAENRAHLDAIKPLFKGKWQPMWDYLQNMWRYEKGEYAAVIASITPGTVIAKEDVLAFSEQVLYAQALEAQKDYRQAELHWRHLLATDLPPHQRRYLQLRLAKALVAQEKTEAIFSPDSPVTSLTWRAQVLKKLASRALLRQQALAGASKQEQRIALFTLLIRDLQEGDAKAWLQDSEMLSRIAPLPESEASAFSDVDLTVFDWQGQDVTPGYACSSLRKTLQMLEKRPRDGHALNCLGEFFSARIHRLNPGPEYDAFPAVINNARGENWRRPRVQFESLSLYRKVIENPHSEPEDRSFALYRAVMCFAPAGLSDCGGDDVEISERKRWFTQLKTEFKGSPWAQKLRYYW